MQFQYSKKINFLVLGISFLILSGLIITFVLRKSPQPARIGDLWDMRDDGIELEGKTVIIRGDSIFDPDSEFRFNAFYLVDSQTANEYRTPEYAFGLG